MKMSNSNQLQTIGNFSPEDLKTMKETLAVGTSDAQFNLFIRTAVASGLNPFLNHIYAIVYNGKMSLQISVEGIVYLAKKVEGYQGIDTQLVHENDDFKAGRVNGEWVIEKHDISFPRGKVIAGYSVAFREGFKPFTVFMDFVEVEHHLSGTNAALWKKYTNDFFKKHLTKRAAKGQFGIEIAEDDNGQLSTGDNIPAYQQPERRDITAEAEQMTNETKQPSKTSAPVGEEEAKLQEARQKMAEKFALLGISDPEEMGKYIAQHAKPKGKKPTLAEMLGLLKIMDMHIEEKKAQEETGGIDLDDELAAELELD